MKELPLSPFVTLTRQERARVAAGALWALQQPSACHVFDISEEERVELVVRLKQMLGVV